ncbi:ATP-binding protein [Nonomuraea sp. NPDC047897]|uniref:ATP-binding protein n=1 Tax=Nonomuraea sp. NPDC047897 TaxID=3364346 RepID=UPI00370F8737
MFDQPLSPPPAGAHRRTFKTLAELARVRSFVETQARSAGLSGSRVARVLLAVNEVATNAFEHTSDGCTVTTWALPHTFVCQIDDDGRFDVPPVRPVAPLSGRGHGLILVEELTDLVRRHSDSGGTTTRLHFDRK